MFTCSTCGKAWPENYCPECAHTIERTRVQPPPLEAAPKPVTSQTVTALNAVSRPGPPIASPIPPPLPRPTVVTLYRIWCGLMLIVYLALAAHEALVFAGKVQPGLGPIMNLASSDDPKLRAQLLEEERANSIIGLGLALAGSALFTTGLFSPRARWAWGVGIAAIIVSIVPLCISLAGAVPLLIFWFKPETRRYFRGRWEASCSLPNSCCTPS